MQKEHLTYNEFVSRFGPIYRDDRAPEFIVVGFAALNRVVSTAVIPEDWGLTITRPATVTLQRGIFEWDFGVTLICSRTIPNCDFEMSHEDAKQLLELPHLPIAVGAWEEIGVSNGKGYTCEHLFQALRNIPHAKTARFRKLVWGVLPGARSRRKALVNRLIRERSKIFHQRGATPSSLETIWPWSESHDVQLKVWWEREGRAKHLKAG